MTTILPQQYFLNNTTILHQYFLILIAKHKTEQPCLYLEIISKNDDGDKEVVLERQYVEETPDSTPKSTQTPESISEPTFIEQWKNSIITERPFFFPWATCFIAIILISIYNYVNPTIRTALYNYLMLNCTAIQNESYQTQNQSYPHFNHRPMTYNFLHLDKDHLRNNILALLVYGIPLEGIIGTPSFVALYSYLCFSISLEWYDKQLALNTCATAQTIVGASGVIIALGPNAVIITLYRLCFKVIVKYISDPETRENQESSLKCVDFILFGIGVFFSRIVSLFINCVLVLAQFLIDKFHPEEGKANDIHLFGVQKGFFGDFNYPPLLLIAYCLFWDLFGPIFRIGYEKLCEKISIALHKMFPWMNNPIKSCLKWFRKCYSEQKCEPASSVQNFELEGIEHPINGYESTQIVN